MGEEHSVEASADDESGGKGNGRTGRQPRGKTPDALTQPIHLFFLSRIQEVPPTLTTNHPDRNYYARARVFPAAVTSHVGVVRS